MLSGKIDDVMYQTWYRMKGRSSEQCLIGFSAWAGVAEGLLSSFKLVPEMSALHT